MIISLAKQIRNHQGELFPDLYDQYTLHYTPQQIELIKDLIRDVCDLDPIEFHQCEEFAQNRVGMEELGDPIDPEWEAMDPKRILG
jgi:hypothetical protein